MLLKDPAKRLSAAQVLGHRWMRSSYLSAVPLSADIGGALARYKRQMAAKMRAGMIAALASVSMMRSATNRRWSTGSSVGAGLLAASRVATERVAPVPWEPPLPGAMPFVTRASSSAAASVACRPALHPLTAP